MSKLSNKELAAIDLMIAQLEEQGKNYKIEGFIGSIVGAVTDIANIATDVTKNAADLATSICPAVAAACPGLATAGKTLDSNSAKLMKEIGESGLPAELTLENLKKIRKENS